MRLCVTDPPPEPVEMHPGKKPVNGQPHVLEVDSDGDGFIAHTHGCLDRFGDPGCDVSYAQDWGEDEDLCEGLVPGEYWIVFRVEGEDDDTVVWLELMYPEEAP